jgi:hypothetical protein
MIANICTFFITFYPLLSGLLNRGININTDFMGNQIPAESVPVRFPSDGVEGETGFRLLDNQPPSIAPPDHKPP